MRPRRHRTRRRDPRRDPRLSRYPPRHPNDSYGRPETGTDGHRDTEKLVSSAFHGLLRHKYPASHHRFEYRRGQVCCLIGHSGQGRRSQKDLDNGEHNSEDGAGSRGGSQ